MSQTHEAALPLSTPSAERPVDALDTLQEMLDKNNQPDTQGPAVSQGHIAEETAAAQAARTPDTPNWGAPAGPLPSGRRPRWQQAAGQPATPSAAPVAESVPAEPERVEHGRHHAHAVETEAPAAVPSATHHSHRRAEPAPEAPQPAERPVTTAKASADMTPEELRAQAAAGRNEPFETTPKVEPMGRLRGILGIFGSNKLAAAGQEEAPESTPVSNLDSVEAGRQTTAVEGGDKDSTTVLPKREADDAKVMTKEEAAAFYGEGLDEDAIDKAPEVMSAADLEALIANPEKRKTWKARALQLSLKVADAIAGKVGRAIPAGLNNTAISEKLTSVGNTAKAAAAEAFPSDAPGVRAIKAIKAKIDMAIIKGYTALPAIGDALKAKLTEPDYSGEGEYKLNARGKAVATVSAALGLLAAGLGIEHVVDQVTQHADTAVQATQVGTGGAGSTTANHVATTPASSVAPTTTHAPAPSSVDLNQGHSPNTGADFRLSVSAATEGAKEQAINPVGGNGGNHAHNIDVGPAHPDSTTTSATVTETPSNHTHNTDVGPAHSIPEQRTGSSANPADQSQATGHGRGPDGRPSVGNQHTTTGSTPDNEQFVGQPQQLNPDSSVWSASADYLHAHGLQGSNAQIAALTNWRLGQMNITVEQARFLHPGQTLPMPPSAQVLDQILGIDRLASASS